MTLRKHWDFSGGIKRVWSGSLVLLIILTPAIISAAPNPHAFMDDSTRCTSCHDRMPDRSSGYFTKDIISLCRECHSMAHRMSHPVDVRPQESALPLNREGAMTCSTCHDPHSDPFSSTPFVNRGILDAIRFMFSSTGYRTYFLRMANNEGQLCLSCHDNQEIDRGYFKASTVFGWDYTGSKACERCHGEVYKEWKKTTHARTLQDPRENPRALTAAFNGQEDFSPEKVEIVVGVHWTQRYIVDRDGEQKVARGIWSMDESRWVRSSGREQLWKDYCAGCHLTGYDPYEDSYVEKGVGCEMCHGPGGGHVRSGNSSDIVNPARLNGNLASSICASCHTSGHDPTGQFRYAAGYIPGQELDLYYRGLMPGIGQEEDTFKGDGTLEDRLRSLGFWFEQFFQPSRIWCRQCMNLDILSASQEAVGNADLTLAQYCVGCHEELHWNPVHKYRLGKDVNCYSCHMPLTDRFGRLSIHDHKYVVDGQ